jgi:hypothetical protein
MCTLVRHTKRTDSGGKPAMQKRQHTNIACPICVRPLRPADRTCDCPHCQQSFHLECWERYGGCNGRGCPNGPAGHGAPTPAAVADPALPDGVEVLSAEPAGTAVARRAPTALGGAADAPPLAPPRHRIWWIPLALVVFTVGVVIVATLVLVPFGLKHRAARDELRTALQQAEGVPPREAVAILDRYLETHSATQFTQEARAQRDAAQARIDEWDWQDALRRVTAAGSNREPAAQALQGYVDRQPTGAHAAEARERARGLRQRMDDEAYDSATRLTDLDAKRSALEKYLARFTEGVHASDARRLLEAIPDEQEDRALALLRTAVGELQSAGAFEQAIARIDAELPRFKAPRRQSELETLRGAVREALTDRDAQAVLALPFDTEAARDAAAAAARLFLLQHSQGPRAERVRARLEELALQTHREALAQLRALLKNITVAEHGLATVREFAAAHPNVLTDDEIRELAQPYWLQVYRTQVLRTPIPDRRRIVLSDGSVLEGELVQKSDVATVLLPNGKKRFVNVSKIVKTEPLPETIAATECRDLLQGETLTARTAVRALALATAGKLDAQISALYACLATLDPTHPEATRHLQGTTYRSVVGGWIREDDLVDVFGGARINGIWVSPDRQAWLQEQLSRARDAVVRHVEQFVTGRPLTVQVELYGMVQPVRVNAGVALAGEPAITEIAAVDQPLAGAVTFNFAVTLSPASVVTDPEISRMVEARVAARSAQCTCRAVLRLKRDNQATVSFGMVLANQGGKWTVASLDAGGPAERAGVEIGDVLVQLGSTVLGPDTAEADLAAQLDGVAGTGATLQFTRGTEPLQVQLVREPTLRKVLSRTLHLEHNLNDNGTPASEPPVELPSS